MSNSDKTGYRREDLLARELPAYEAAIAQMRAYIARTGMTIDAFAHHLGYSGQTVDLFLQGRYQRHGCKGRSTRTLTAHAVDFMERYPAGESTGLDEVAGKLYATENSATLREWFDYCLRRGKMCCVYGGPGSQKSFVAQHLVADLNTKALAAKTGEQAHLIYCSEGIRPAEIIRKLMEAAGLPYAGLMQRNLATLRFSLRAHRVLFIFDEAQHLSLPCLEIIRELNDLRPHFGVILLGSHHLQRMFQARAAELEQWNSRIARVVELPGIGYDTAASIVMEELRGLVEVSPNKLAKLLGKCMVADSYSKQSRGNSPRQYLSARLLFNSIATIKEQIESPRTEVAQ